MLVVADALAGNFKKEKNYRAAPSFTAFMLHADLLTEKKQQIEIWSKESNSYDSTYMCR